MLRILLRLLAAGAAAVAIAGLVVAAAIFGWGRAPIAPRGDTEAFVAAAEDRLARESHGAYAFALIEDGRKVAERYGSKGAPVNGQTLFQVASLSKWITAVGVMNLVEEGGIDLDAPVSTYLTRWSLPPSDFDNDAVTVRRLLSHTAGLTDGLGYAGFPWDGEVQPLEASLTQAADASPGHDGRVRVGAEPGEGFAYSGGGYTLLQLLVEEVTGQSFADYMAAEVLAPMGMTNSSFAAPPLERLAPNYDKAGKIAPMRRFTALAAASLYTSADDLAAFVAAHRPGGHPVLQPETFAAMREAHARELGADIWGLGVVLYAPNGQGDTIVGHDGSNEPAINTTARVDPTTGDGIVVLDTGDAMLATELAGEWVFWKTGNVDVLLQAAEFGDTLKRAALAGLAAFVLAALVLLWPRRRKAAAA